MKRVNLESILVQAKQLVKTRVEQGGLTFPRQSQLEVGIEVVAPGGFEPPSSWLRTRRPRPLDHGATVSAILYPIGTT